MGDGVLQGSLLGPLGYYYYNDENSELTGRKEKLKIEKRIEKRSPTSLKDKWYQKKKKVDLM
ncbi:unnamed protein product [Leptidea sinapis]|uniref:Uncharacterized protein n=1 Tax=Leptidea sinapis TaxID=189913 RepID=A0A5E4QBC2_9NEOP|nr:unnamed protein product [Leptidea sinapis]